MTTTAPSLSLRSLLGKTAVVSALGRSPITAGLTPEQGTCGGPCCAILRRPHAARRPDRSGRRADDLRRAVLLCALEGASSAAVEQAVLPLPSIQVDPYEA